MTIEEEIEYEREALAIAIFPRERREHAERLAKLEVKRASQENKKPSEEG
jgi:uncharacterized protein (UPF0212 family)